VGLRAAARSDGVELAVWDTGAGIAPPERSHVFERFYRGSAAEAAGIAGSGLGLAIVKAVADGHGAALSLEDRSGGGLEVVVRFPRRAATRTPALTERA
jgi:signal transduction histidine kinase